MPLDRNWQYSCEQTDNLDNSQTYVLNKQNKNIVRLLHTHLKYNIIPYFEEIIQDML